MPADGSPPRAADAAPSTGPGPAAGPARTPDPAAGTTRAAGKGPATAKGPAAGTGPVAVVVVTWNSAAVLPEFLAALPAGMAGTNWRLVVADNDSADRTVAVLRELAPQATVVATGRNAGYAAGVNAALAAAAGLPGGCSAALVCNPDVRMRPGCGRALLDALDEELPGGERVGIAVPLLYERGAAQPSRSLRRAPTVARALGEAVLGNRRAGRFPHWGELVTDPAAYAGPTRADWATGALMALSARCLEVCGPWRESFFLYSEETEFCLRAGDRGLATRLVPSASAVHLGGQSQVSPYLWTLLTANRVRLFRLRHGAAASVLFWAAVTLRELSRAAIGKRASRAAAATLLRPWLLARPPGPAAPPGAAEDQAAHTAKAGPTAPGGAGGPGR